MNTKVSSRCLLQPPYELRGGVVSNLVAGREADPVRGPISKTLSTIVGTSEPRGYAVEFGIALGWTEPVRRFGEDHQIRLRYPFGTDRGDQSVGFGKVVGPDRGTFPSGPIPKVGVVPCTTATVAVPAGVGLGLQGQEARQAGHERDRGQRDRSDPPTRAPTKMQQAGPQDHTR